MEVDRREKSVEQSTNAILNPSARSENTFFVNCPVSEIVSQGYFTSYITLLLGGVYAVCTILGICPKGKE